MPGACTARDRVQGLAQAPAFCEGARERGVDEGIVGDLERQSMIPRKDSEFGLTGFGFQDEAGRAKFLEPHTRLVQQPPAVDETTTAGRRPAQVADRQEAEHLVSGGGRNVVRGPKEPLGFIEVPLVRADLADVVDACSRIDDVSGSFPCVLTSAVEVQGVVPATFEIGIDAEVVQHCPHAHQVAQLLVYR